MALAEDAGTTGDNTEGSLSAEAVRAAVERIVSSPDFVASERARRFLRYVVEETLGGRADRIKAFSVAVEVFGRDETFDAQNDPVVRIEAGRLRRALEHYYLLAGSSDPVVIEIPKGGYVPVFGTNEPLDAPARQDPGPPEAAGPPGERRASASRLWMAAGLAATVMIAGIASYAAGFLPIGAGEPAGQPTGPTLLVLPFTDLGDGPVSALYSGALTDEIVSELARFKEITVFGVQTSRSVGKDAEIGRLLDDLKVLYILEGSVRTDAGRIRVNSRLLSAETRAVLWTQGYEHPVTAADLFEIQVETAEEVATAIAQPYGIVFRAERSRALAAPPDNLDAYLCTLSFYVYRAAPSAPQHAEVRTCLEGATARFPAYATARSLLALAYVDEIRAGFNPTPDAAEKAISTAREAVRLDAGNARALQALAMALFYGGEPTEAFEIGERAIAINPNDTELLGQLGLQAGISGQPAEGRALLERALAKNPGHSSFYRGALATIAYIQGDYPKALAEIDRIDLRDLPIYHGVAAMIYAQSGEDGKARDMAARFQEMAPDFVPNLWAELDLRNIPVEAQLSIAEGLRKAGLSIPPPPEGASAFGARTTGSGSSRT